MANNSINTNTTEPKNSLKSIQNSKLYTKNLKKRQILKYNYFSIPSNYRQLSTIKSKQPIAVFKKDFFYHFVILDTLQKLQQKLEKPQKLEKLKNFHTKYDMKNELIKERNSKNNVKELTKRGPHKTCISDFYLYYLNDVNLLVNKFENRTDKNNFIEILTKMLKQKYCTSSDKYIFFVRLLPLVIIMFHTFGNDYNMLFVRKVLELVNDILEKFVPNTLIKKFLKCIFADNNFTIKLFEPPISDIIVLEKKYGEYYEEIMTCDYILNLMAPDIDQKNLPVDFNFLVNWCSCEFDCLFDFVVPSWQRVIEVGDVKKEFLAYYRFLPKLFKNKIEFYQRRKDTERIKHYTDLILSLIIPLSNYYNEVKVIKDTIELFIYDYDEMNLFIWFIGDYFYQKCNAIQKRIEEYNRMRKKHLCSLTNEEVSQIDSKSETADNQYHGGDYEEYNDVGQHDDENEEKTIDVDRVKEDSIEQLEATKEIETDDTTEELEEIDTIDQIDDRNDAKNRNTKSRKRKASEDLETTDSKIKKHDDTKKEYYVFTSKGICTVVELVSNTNDDVVIIVDENTRKNIMRSGTRISGLIEELVEPIKKEEKDKKNVKDVKEEKKEDKKEDKDENEEKKSQTEVDKSDVDNRRAFDKHYESLKDSVDMQLQLEKAKMNFRNPSYRWLLDTVYGNDMMLWVGF